MGCGSSRIDEIAKMYSGEPSEFDTCSTFISSHNCRGEPDGSDVIRDSGKTTYIPCPPAGATPRPRPHPHSHDTYTYSHTCKPFIPTYMSVMSHAPAHPATPYTTYSW